MLEKFGVIVFSEYLTQTEREMTIRAFSDFYHNITPKHQKRVVLHWHSKGDTDLSGIKKAIIMFEVPIRNIQFSTTENRSEVMKEAKICIHPSRKYFTNVIPKSLSFGIPVITLEDFFVGDYVNQSCGITINCESNEQIINELTYYLDMLYFDNEVLKVLEKGAYDQYEKKFGWGLKQFRKNN